LRSFQRRPQNIDALPRSGVHDTRHVRSAACGFDKDACGLAEEVLESRGEQLDPCFPRRVADHLECMDGIAREEGDGARAGFAFLTVADELIAALDDDEEFIRPPPGGVVSSPSDSRPPVFGTPSFN
jgi:hypothetical protein